MPSRSLLGEEPGKVGVNTVISWRLAKRRQISNVLTGPPPDKGLSISIGVEVQNPHTLPPAQPALVKASPVSLVLGIPRATNQGHQSMSRTPRQQRQPGALRGLHAPEDQQTRQGR